MRTLRFFYVPNEMVEGDQVGPRKAFGQLHAEGVFSAYMAYSYLVERTRAASQAQALERLYAAVDAFQPDVIYFQHLNGSYPVDSAYIRRLKSVASRPRFVWHDPDPYGRFIKPIDPVMKAVLAETDLAVVKGLGYFSAAVRRAGAQRILFAPESFDDERFARGGAPSATRPLDAVMIANLTCLKRIPWLFMPGGRSRKTTARLLHRAYGERFAVFGGGQGWRGEAYCRGSIAFERQEEFIRSAWISVNWSQFDEIPFYFSDRLPISLAAGVPHVTNHQRGFEHVLGQAQGVYFVHSPAEALDAADYLLSLPREQLIEIGEQGRAYARERLNATRVYRDVVTAIREQLFDAADAVQRGRDEHSRALA
jgi:hypothetical protein